MPAFGKKQKEESINDKMVRLFKEGKSVADIAKELEVKADVITNVIRRRCGEDSIPETVIRSKNAIAPPAEEQTLKADMAVPSSTETAAEEPAPAEENTEGMSKLERYMLEKEKEKAEKEAAVAAEEPEKPADGGMEEVSMEGISTDDLDLDLGVAEEPAPAPAAETVEEEPAAEMEGISAEDIPEIAEDKPIIEHPVAEYNDGSEPAAEETKPETASFTVPEGGSAFDKMKAFAMSQIEVNNAKIAELEAKVTSVESDYNAKLADAEKAVEESKVTYEDVLTRGDEVSEKRMAAQTEHRAALARAEEDYRKKLAELDEEYNNATAHANKVLADKEVEINAASDAIEAEKETAKNNFLDNQAAVNDLKNKIAEEVDAVKAQINAIKEENAGYEQFMG